VWIREGVGEGVGRWFDSNIRGVVGDGRGTYFWHDTWVGEIPLKNKFPRLFDLSVDKECSVEKMWRVLGEVEGRESLWRRRLFSWEEESVSECYVLLHNFVLQENVEDKWTWRLDPTHGYSVRGAYRFLTTAAHLGDRHQVVDIWHRFLLRRRCLCGAFFTIDFQLRIIWFGGGSFLMKTRLVCLVVGVKRQQIIYFWDVTSSDYFGLRFGFGWVFLQSHRVTLFNI